MSVEVLQVIGLFVALASGAVVVMVAVGLLRLLGWFVRVLFSVDRWM